MGTVCRVRSSTSALPVAAVLDKDEASFVACGENQLVSDETLIEAVETVTKDGHGASAERVAPLVNMTPQDVVVRLDALVEQGKLGVIAGTFTGDARTRIYVVIENR
jgi:hypothetical protein